MLPNQEDYVVGEPVPLDNVFDFLLLYFQTQNHVPTIQLIVDNLSKNTSYARQHDLHANMELLNCIVNDKKIENIVNQKIIQNIGPVGVYVETSLNFNIKEFLLEYGINLEDMDYQKYKDSKEAAYYQSIRYIVSHFEREIHKLNSYYDHFRNRLNSLLNGQACARIIHPAESYIRYKLLYNSFNVVFEKLVVSFREIMQHLINGTKKNEPKRRQFFTDEARDILNTWFQEHVTDPYPSEIEKQELADACGISILQVNYWFGNKRNRYKKQHGSAAKRKKLN